MIDPASLQRFLESCKRQPKQTMPLRHITL